MIKHKIGQLINHWDQVNSMQVKLSKEHQIDKNTHKGCDNQIAEAIVRLPGMEFFVQVCADDR